VEQTYLLKIGELTLKGGNRSFFEKTLRGNLAVMLKGSGAHITAADGRLYVHCMAEAAASVEDALSRLAGITGWAAARKTEKTPEAVIAAAVEEAQKCCNAGIKTFKIEARRTDKSFPLDSYAICRTAGDAVLQAVPALKVDVHKPDTRIGIEIREKAYIYGFEHAGLRGLPVGTAARGLLLLSGGIDSPVAGYLMALRGMRFHAVYYHAPPYTSSMARSKVTALARIIGRYAMGTPLHIPEFTEVQLAIKNGASEEWRTLLLRMAMFEGADRLAARIKCKSLITGESLAQVASQTVENIGCAQSRTALPIMRPLIGMDKEDIVKIASAIGTYKTSILPYQDCCTLFSPPHPILRASLPEAAAFYESLNLTPLIEAALCNRDVER
jgi:thiamine biosynthesis protein ThiI